MPTRAAMVRSHQPGPSTQLLTGEGEDSLSQSVLPDMEPDLPAIQAGSVDSETGEIFELERRGQQRLID